MVQLAVSPMELAVAAIAAGVIAQLAHRRHLLDASGTIAAIILGPMLVATGGWWLGVLLIAFFVTASLLPTKDHNGPARTWRQVLANGGPALTFATLDVLAGQPAWLIGAGATLAAAASDTWATELGRAWGGTPISIRTGRQVTPGASGAVSGVGTAASIAGAVAIAVLASLLGFLDPEVRTGGRAIAIIATSGMLGSALDTVLGGTLQARFQCSQCSYRSEAPDEHQPHHLMRHIAGAKWMTNSVVNLLSTVCAGFAGTALAIATL